MIIVRNSFTAKPGQAGKLAAQLKEASASSPMKNPRILTDITGEFNRVILEYEVDSVAEFEKLYEQYGNDASFREKMKGYTDHWMTGSRELLRVV